MERFCVRIKATAVCSARSEQCHVHRSNRTIPVVVEPRTPTIVGQTGCEIDCATLESAPLNQRCACEVVDILRLHESIRGAFPEFTTDPAVHAHLFSGIRIRLWGRRSIATRVFAVVGGTQMRRVDLRRGFRVEMD